MSRTAFITGATSGIGYELSKIFAQEAVNLVLVSRNGQKLKVQKEDFEKRYKGNVCIIAKDLSRPNVAEEIFSDVQRQGIHIDILVNNAGFNESGPFYETNLEKELEMLQVHIISLTQLTKLFLPGMIKNKYGKILNLGSTGSFTPCPLDAVYCASKAYVITFRTSLTQKMLTTSLT